MASKFAAELLEKIDQGDGMLVALEITEYEGLIDAELAEVREVLESFGCKVLSGSKGLCFGAFGSSCDDTNHAERCQRARTLYEKLIVR